jgi:hypothetical protein
LRADGVAAGRLGAALLPDLAPFALAADGDFAAADCALVAAGLAFVWADCDLDRVAGRVLPAAVRLEDAARGLPPREGSRIALDLLLLVRLRVLLLPAPRELLLRVDDPRRDFPPLVAIYDSPRNRKCGTDC